MTGSQLITAVRRIVRDSAVGTSTAARFYTNDEIIAALVTARQEAASELLDRGRPLTTHTSLQEYASSEAPGFPISIPRLTLCGLFKQVAFAGDGQIVPVDFWRLENGVTDDSQYIKAGVAPLSTGMLAATWERSVYVSNNAFYGTPCTVFYWANPTTTIADNGTDLNAGTTPLPDSFYNAVSYLALVTLMSKERGDAENRIKMAMEVYKDRIGSLR